MEKSRITDNELIEIVDSKIKKVRTRSLDLSFNELLDMYENGELIIDPDYQRLFRWSEEKQSRFIESLILEMPIPPIYVIEREEGVYELIDGLQRISSYLHFRGSLKTKKNQYLTLTGCDIVNQLDGYTYNDLPKPLQIKLKRNFVRVEIIRRESDQRLRYYMFKRLNTGGELLSEQEIRNCTIRLLDDKFNEFIIELSKNEDFVNCISNLSDEKKDQKYDEELVLRFFAFKNYRHKYRHDVGSFMTDYMEGVSYKKGEEGHIEFDYDKEREIFNKTFKVLNLTLGEYVFSRTNNNGKFISSFSPYHFEAFTLGIQKYLDQINYDNEFIEKLKNEFIEIKNDSNFKALTTGGGKNTPNQLAQRIKFVEDRVGALINERN
ncbi:DUF262 domain-containing protein [Aeribacillus sp. FSL K6-2848]|uniref:DUF262 domain-containing protein n=1 Tax=unclassified Aeribacillus TaxID=2640495 RepID=UPI0030CB51C4